MTTPSSHKKLTFPKASYCILHLTNLTENHTVILLKRLLCCTLCVVVRGLKVPHQQQLVYGEKLQKFFDMHVCVKCNKWFHMYCLTVCGLQVPKRNHNYIGPECKLQSTLPWNNDTYTNTCTCDNILTILLLYSKQYNTFLSALKSGLHDNNGKWKIGNINRGKTVILDNLRSSLNLPRARNKFNCLWALNLPSFVCIFPCVQTFSY